MGADQFVQIQPKGVKAVLISGIWYEVEKESFCFRRIAVSDAERVSDAFRPWEPGFVFAVNVEGESAIMAGPLLAIQAVRV